MRLHPILFFILQISPKIFYYSPPHFHDHFVCPCDQRPIWLQFKQNFDIDSDGSFDCDYNIVPSQLKIMSWNISMDCFKWEGLMCDGSTGHVIGLDLSHNRLKGAIHSTSTLFQFSHLKRLNLIYNVLSFFRIS